MVCAAQAPLILFRNSCSENVAVLLEELAQAPNTDVPAARTRTTHLWVSLTLKVTQQLTQLWLLTAPRLSSNKTVSGNGWIR